MGQKSFSMGEAIGFGWNTMKSNIGFFIGLLIIAFLIESIPSAIGNIVSRDFPFISLIFYFAGWVLGFVVQMGLIKISLNFCDGVKGQFNDLLSSFNLLITFIAGSILYGLIILGGFLLLIVPGIIWTIKFSLFSYFIIDHELGPIEALKASAKATMGAKWNLFLFGLLLGLINFAGALCLLIGLFATIPISMVAFAHVYRHLASQTEGIKGAIYINL